MDELFETGLRPALDPPLLETELALASLHPTGFERPLRPPTRIGRDPASELLLDDSSISRHHAAVEVEADHLVVRDLGSKNGTSVNRRRVDGLAPIAAGDVVRLGDVILSVVRAGAGRATDGTDHGPASPMIGGRSLAQARRHIELLGPTSLRILVTGESGTGKDLVARELHRHSGLSGPFIALNCAALPESLVEEELFGHVRGAFTGAVSDKPGLFEAARGGTLFLDEVAELPLASQAKLLRAVESGQIRRVGAVRDTAIDCRVISATNRDLKRDVSGGRFRGDLMARLAEAEIALPPLRARVEDLPLLIEHLGRRAGCQLAFSADAFEVLATYAWPLNVRELDNVIRMLHALSDGGEVELSALPPHLLAGAAGAGLHAGVPGSARSDEVLAALRENGGNIRRTGQQLGVSRTFIYRCLDRAGLRAADLRGADGPNSATP